MTEVPILPGSAAALAELRASTGLQMPDCGVLLAADTIKAAAVATFDARLARVAASRGYAPARE